MGIIWLEQICKERNDTYTMSYINGKFAEYWIELNHTVNGLFSAYWKNVNGYYA